MPVRPAEPADPSSAEASPVPVRDKPVRAREQKRLPNVRPSWEATIADQMWSVQERIVIRLPKPALATPPRSSPPVEASWELVGRSVREDVDDRR